MTAIETIETNTARLLTVVTAGELMAGYDRPPADVEDSAPESLFVSAQRT